MSQLNNIYLDTVYTNLQTEQTSILNTIKNEKEPEQEKNNHQQVLLLTNIMSGLLKLKSLKKKKESDKQKQ